MSFMDDLKTDQRTQILVAGIVFFAIAFPAYFGYAASNVDDYDLTGPIGTFEIDGNLTYIEIGAGSETIADQGTATIAVNSDSVNFDDENIVGFRIKLTHSDEESPCAPTATPQADDISSIGGINENTTSLSGSDANLEESLFWINNSIIDGNISDVTESDVHQMLEGGNTGSGTYTFDITVNVNRGSASALVLEACQNDDSDEQVDWIIELISLDYTVEMVEDEEEEEGEEPEE